MSEQAKLRVMLLGVLLSPLMVLSLIGGLTGFFYLGGALFFGLFALAASAPLLRVAFGLWCLAEGAIAFAKFFGSEEIALVSLILMPAAFIATLVYFVRLRRDRATFAGSHS
jgi:hypothetical protein